jgi:hypothetical protein
MMQWCKEHHINPANKEAWEMAEQAYSNYLSKNNERK